MLVVGVDDVDVFLFDVRLDVDAVVMRRCVPSSVAASGTSS